jgi:hypothetical protein
MPEGEGRTRKLNAEIANGRLAMMAIIGMFYQDGLTGQAWGDWELYTDSPLRDGLNSSSWAAGAEVSAGSGTAAVKIPDRQVGATAPMGDCWDPCGLSRNSSDEEFRNLRTAELKHGRIAMLANIGLLAQSSGLRFPGYDNIPSGIEACTTGPAAGGFGLLVLCAGWFELKFFKDEGREPGNFGNPLRVAGDRYSFGFVNVLARQIKGEYSEKWRNMELNNGRLAMIGFIGCVTAEYISGYDALGQWQHAGQAAGDTLRKTIPYMPAETIGSRFASAGWIGTLDKFL